MSCRAQSTSMFRYWEEGEGERGGRCSFPQNRLNPVVSRRSRTRRCDTQDRCPKHLIFLEAILLPIFRFAPIPATSGSPLEAQWKLPNCLLVPNQPATCQMTLSGRS